MRHLAAILGALLCAATGLMILWLTHAATTPALIAGTVFVLLALALAIPAQLQTAGAQIVALAKSAKDAAAPSSGGAS